MTTEISLKETERKVFRSAYQVGLVDIFIGCYLLMFAIAPFLSRYLGDFWSSMIFLPFWGAVYLLLAWIRKNVVQPRIGTVKYGSWRVRRMVRFNALMVFVLLIAFLLGILSAVRFDLVPGWVHIARFSLIFLIGFSLAAYFLEFTRLYVYGVMIALAPIIGEFLWVYRGVPHHGFPVTFGLTAVLIIMTGVYLLVRLIRKHPINDYPQEFEGTPG